MRLTQLALDKIKDSRTLPKKIQSALGVSRGTMWRYLNENSDELTKAAALEVIRKETGFSDLQILEKQVATV